MRRRFQVRQVVRKGRKKPLWIGRYWQPVLKEGKFARVRKAEILGACDVMSKSQAKQALKDILQPINDGRHVPECASTFDELWRKWQKQILCNYRESTRGFYERAALRWVVPYFGRWPLADITAFACQEYINQFNGYSKSVIKRVRATLSRILAGAIDWGWIKENPASKLKLPEGRSARQAAILTPQELVKVMDGLGEPYRTMVVIEVYTGLRESELMTLRWGDFDRERKVMRVQRSEYRNAVGETKTGPSRREIPYGDRVADALTRLEAAGHKRGDYLFVAPRGGFDWGQKVTRQVFKPLAKKLKIPAFTWRSFRRSLYTALNTAGAPLKTQQGIMGHVTVEMALLCPEAAMDAKWAVMQEWDNTLSGCRTTGSMGLRSPILSNPNTRKLGRIGFVSR